MAIDSIQNNVDQNSLAQRTLGQCQSGPCESPACYHCGLPVPAGAYYPVVLEKKTELMCCPGCQAVAMAIADGGLENFYRFRTEASQRPEADTLRDFTWKIYDLPEVQADFVLALDAQTSQANLLLEGISCAACSWLVESHLKKHPAVTSVTVNITTHRCRLVWNPQAQPLSELLLALAEIGYRPRPASDEQQQDLLRKENRKALFRIGVAGFAMMQTMMVAVGMYTGASEAWLEFLRWQSLLVATPVVLFSCRPFFAAAWRSVQTRHLVMDVPVALAIGLAYLASAWATVFSVGEVYFESISMFAFFLLLGRYIEMRARHRNRTAFSNLAQLMPLTARCLSPHNCEARQVPLNVLAIGDRVLVKAGETFPCDGLVETGESSAVEAIITGEFNPVAKRPGDSVIAGALNTDSSLIITVTATGAATRMSAIERLAAQAAEEKPREVTLADKIARFFIARLLIVCAFVFAFWWWYEPSRALWVTLSVLVVTCPCALALAMPAALSATTANLRRQGLLVVRGHVVETLPLLERVIFDKTGTLTRGQFVVEKTLALRDLKGEECLAVAAALEATSNHPLARAFSPWRGLRTARDLRQQTAAGVEGRIAGAIYRLGAPAYVSEIFSAAAIPPLPEGEILWLLLGDSQGPLAWIGLTDELRPGAAEVVSALLAEGVAVELMSGDPSAGVARLARQLGIREFTAGAKPEDKLARLQAAQARGEKVLMLGDGINDVPVLSAADVSIAMASASDLAQTRADGLLLNERLDVLFNALLLARQTRRIIRQNLRFSLTYNVLALPLAAAGFIAPWMAAIGMTASSLVVVFNSLRLNEWSARPQARTKVSG